MYLAYLLAILFIMAFFALQTQLDVKWENVGGAAAEEGGKKKKKKAPVLKNAVTQKDISINVFIIAAVVIFVIRILFAAFTKPYPSDMSCWMAWGNRLLENGPSGFYEEGYFCDYPPGYMIVLSLFAGLGKAITFLQNNSELLYKLPPVLCDMGLMITAFVIGSKEINKKSGLILGILFGVCPLFLINSAFWSQIESVLALPLVISLYLLYKKKYISSALLYAVAILLKPQALMVGPVYLFAALWSVKETKSVKALLQMVVTGFVAVYVVMIPFNNVWATDAGFFSKLITSLNPSWLIEKYISTLSSYRYFTVNAYNFWGLIGFNWRSIDGAGALSSFASVFNVLSIIIAVLLGLYIFVKVKNRGSKLFLTGYFIVAFLFTFGLKMHERYLVTAIILLLFEYMFSKNKHILYAFTLMAAANVLNVESILRYQVIFSSVQPPYSVVGLASFIEVAAFLISAGIIYYDYILKPETVNSQNPGVSVIDRITSKISGCALSAVNKIQNGFYNITRSGRPELEPVKSEKMLRMDYIALAIIVVLYSILAYVNLGSVHNPQTFYQPERSGDSFTVEFDQVENVEKITYYLGVGNVGDEPTMTLEYSVDGNTWHDLSEECKLESVFKWEVLDSESFSAKYVRAKADSTEYRMFEIAFWSANNELIKISNVTGTGDADYGNVADEQEYAQYETSYMNSTYFDEIYHPRTAYEHLHMMPYYETTHPPLGKLIMAVGIAIFGMTPFGWRFTGATFGILMLPLLYVLLKKLFGRTRYSVIGTALFAFDFMHFSLTRLGTIDSYPVTFIIAMYLFMYLFGKRAAEYAKENAAQNFKNPRIMLKLIGILALSGLCFGLGAASKWTSMYAGAGLAVELLLILINVYMTLPKKDKKLFIGFVLKICSSCLVSFILIPGLIYLLSYLPISMVDGYPDLWHTMLNNQEYMFNYHSNLTATHPYSSKWYQWPIDYRPLWAYSAPVETVGSENIGCISVFGNPLIWWTGIAAVIYSAIVGIIKRDKRVLFLMVGLAAQIIPWMFVTRCVFIYHFFASVPFMIILIVYAIADLEKRFGWFKYLTHIFIALCGLLFVAFYPVLSGMTITKEYSDTWLRWMSSWVFHNR